MLLQSGQGMFTVGGLRACELTNIVGVLVGSSLRAAPDVAIPTIPTQTLHESAQNQREARSREANAPEFKARIAALVVALGVDPQDLPIVKRCRRLVNLGPTYENYKAFRGGFLCRPAHRVPCWRVRQANLCSKSVYFQYQACNPYFCNFAFIVQTKSGPH